MSLKDIIKPYGEPITTGMPDSILSGLYRTVLSDLGIEETRFLTLVHKYALRTVTAADPKKLSSEKGNLRSKLLKSVMTWKVFVEGLQVINVLRVEVGIQVWFNDVKREPVSVLRMLTLTDAAAEGDTERDRTFLSMFFQDLLFATGVREKEFDELMAQYIRRSHVPLNMKDVSSARGNIKKELMSPSMTWKVFIKGLVFLDVSQFVFVVRLHHRRGDITEHRRSIILDQVIDDT